jgi:hypothetical protein
MPHPNRSAGRGDARRVPATLFTAGALALVTALPACVVYEPVPVTTIAQPSMYDRSFDAALAAAGDLGVRVSASDRAAGVIRGQLPAHEVTINVRRDAGGGASVEFTTRGPRDDTLSERFTAAYRTRVGR